MQLFRGLSQIPRHPSIRWYAALWLILILALAAGAWGFNTVQPGPYPWTLLITLTLFAGAGSILRVPLPHRRARRRLRLWRTSSGLFVPTLVTTCTAGLCTVPAATSSIPWLLPLWLGTQWISPWLTELGWLVLTSLTLRHLWLLGQPLSDTTELASRS